MPFGVPSPHRERVADGDHRHDSCIHKRSHIRITGRPIELAGNDSRNQQEDDDREQDIIFQTLGE